MNIRAKLTPAQHMTIEEFLAFYDTRPKGEKWELIEGVAVMSPTPVEHHQVIVGNIVTFLLNHKRRTGATWIAMPGVGTRVPVAQTSLPEPDIFVKATPATDRSITEDALVIIEVLSRSNTKADRAWRKRVYASVPNCQHYVTVSMKKPLVEVFDRATDWKDRLIEDIDAAAALPAIGLSIPLEDIYRWTPLERA